jgi:hypothetical protein
LLFQTMTHKENRSCNLQRLLAACLTTVGRVTLHHGTTI